MNITETLNKHKTPEEMAGIWFMHLSEPDCDESDRIAFEKWRAENYSHAEAYSRIERSLAFADQHSSNPLLAELMDEVLKETEPMISRWIVNRWVMSSAAIACTVMIAFISLIYYPQNLDGVVVHDTVVGERSTIVLSDGSTVTLNTDSQIEVDFSEDQRAIKLVRGQAMFEVAKNKELPFVVEAGNQRITALGTAFDVRLDNDVEAVKIILVEGRVAVDEFLASARNSLQEVVSTKRIELNVGERLIASANMPRSVEQVNLEDVTSWQSGKITFREELLKQTVREMNRYSSEKIRLADDPRVKNLRISGIFKTGRIDSFVYVLESSYSLEAQRTGKKEITLTWRED